MNVNPFQINIDLIFSLILTLLPSKQQYSTAALGDFNVKIKGKVKQIIGK